MPKWLEQAVPSPIKTSVPKGFTSATTAQTGLAFERPAFNFDVTDAAYAIFLLTSLLNLHLTMVLPVQTCIAARVYVVVDRGAK